MINIKENKGITLVSLVVTIIILLILTGITIHNFSMSNEKAYYNKMISDIEQLNDKIVVYYNKYGEIPKYDEDDERSRTIIIDGIKYYEIVLSKLDNITLNYGKGYGESNNLVIDKSDVYVVNDALEVYYVQGISLNGERHYCLEDNYSESEIKMVSGDKNSEGVYTTEVSIEIVPGKYDLSGGSEITYSCNFTDKNGNTEQILNENITENKTIKLDKSGTYHFVVATVDKNGNTTTIEKTININIKQPTVILADVITPDNYGDVIEYEANGVKDWKIFFNDGNNVFIITSKVIPDTSMPENSKMISKNTYKIGWEPIYGAPAPGFEYGHAPIVTDITENSKILERAQKFKCNWIQENIDKDWNNAKSVKDLLNNDIWNVFAEGLEGAEAIGSPSLEMFVESWEQKGYKKIKYSYNEDGYSLGDTGDWFGLAIVNEYQQEPQDPLYIPHQLNTDLEDKEWNENINCLAYWLAGASINDSHSLVVADGRYRGLFGDWYSAFSYGLRPVVCLPSNAMATLEDGVWTNLTAD